MATAREALIDIGKTRHDKKRGHPSSRSRIPSMSLRRVPVTHGRFSFCNMQRVAVQVSHLPRPRDAKLIELILSHTTKLSKEKIVDLIAVTRRLG